MISIHALLYWGRGGLQLVARLGRYLIIFLWGLCQPKAVLFARTLALQSQLAACLEQINKRETPKAQFHPRGVTVFQGPWMGSVTRLSATS